MSDAGTDELGIDAIRVLTVDVDRGIRFHKDCVLQQVEYLVEYLVTQIPIAMELLDSFRYGWDIVAAACVELDVFNGDLPECHLGSLDGSHGGSPANIVSIGLNSCTLGRNGAILLPGKSPKLLNFNAIGF